MQVGVDEVVHNQHVQHGAGAQAGQLRVVRRTRAAAGRSRDKSEGTHARMLKATIDGLQATRHVTSSRQLAKEAGAVHGSVRLLARAASWILILHGS